MNHKKRPDKTFLQLGVAFSAVVLLLAGSDARRQEHGDPHQAQERYIVQAGDALTAALLVTEVGGTVIAELDIIGGVTAELTAVESDALATAWPAVRLFADRRTAVAGKKTTGGGGDTSGDTTTDSGGKKGGGGSSNDFATIPDTAFPRLVGAPLVWAQNLTGRGVGVAVLDTAVKYTHPSLQHDTAGLERVLAFHDAIENVTYDFVAGVNRKKLELIPTDLHGHGSHVAGIAVGSQLTETGEFAGVAPDANLIVVRALGDDGSGTYTDVIKGVDWVVKNRELFGIRVLNLSLSAAPQSAYWDDPINQALMKAWQAGIVVVASAGNTGPDPMTIGVPGNLPYLVTVGAMSDAVTPDLPGDDFLTSFSAAGPTVEGFVKPELVAPGGHVVSSMKASTYLATLHEQYRVGDQYFRMSGTSQATGLVSGVVALMLELDPGLGPDDVKCRLLASARPALDDLGNRSYSVFQQGAGMVDAYAAVFSTATGCANRGLDLDAELAGLDSGLPGTVHFGGRANRDELGNYYLVGLDGDGYTWDGAFTFGGGYTWSDAAADGLLWSDTQMLTGGTVQVDGLLWADGFTWTDGLLWSDGQVVGDGFVWADSYVWDPVKFKDQEADTMSVNSWVPQE